MTHWENLPSSSEVEHLTVNQNVAGSIPAGGANVDSSSIGRAPDCGSGGCEFDSHLSTQNGAVAHLGEHNTCTVEVAGSIPVGSTI